MAGVLTRKQFDILERLAEEKRSLTQRELVEKTGFALGTVNKLVKEMTDAGWIYDKKITDNGIKVLAAYKADNAIIMAAGMSSRFAPLSYEIPKGLLKVKGEILIERQIRQLQEAGIDVYYRCCRLYERKIFLSSRKI